MNHYPGEGNRNGDNYKPSKWAGNDALSNDPFPLKAPSAEAVVLGTRTTLESAEIVPSWMNGE